MEQRILELGGRRVRRRLASMAFVVAALTVPLGIHAARAADATVDGVSTVWDYRTIFVVWDEPAEDWRADWTDGRSTVGLEAVLDAEGAVGWELVEIVHERYDTLAAGETTSQEATRLRLVFKRMGSVAPAAPLVAVSGFSFQPGSLEIGVGTTLRWENDDPTAHTVTSSDGSFDSGAIAPGADYEFTFEVAGTYAYACAIHPSMVATVVVS